MGLLYNKDVIIFGKEVLKILTSFNENKDYGVHNHPKIQRLFIDGPYLHVVTDYC